MLVHRGTTNHFSRVDFEAVVDDGPTLRFGFHHAVPPFDFSLAQIRAKSLDLFHEPVDLIEINPMTLFALALNRPELQLGEVLIPWVVVVGTFGFLAAWLVVAIMERTGLSRYVWHLPLFFLALVVLLSSVIGAFFQP
jgi:Protein of unknown function (DUF1656)